MRFRFDITYIPISDKGKCKRTESASAWLKITEIEAKNMECAQKKASKLEEKDHKILSMYGTFLERKRL